MSEFTNNEQSAPNQTIIISQPPENKSNGLGTAGFVLALISFFLCWIPYLGWILWTLGFIFSFVGVFKAPRGLAIAGLVISCIGLIFLLVVVALIMAAFGAIALM